MKNIVSLLIIIVILWWTFSKGQTSSKVQKKENPNVIFILTDDQVYRSIHSLNNKEIYTPNLDKLARSSKILTNVFNQGANQGAVCVSSRSMINTGLPLWQAHKKINTDSLWGETFKNSNYITFLVGKWHNGESTLRRSFEWIGTKDGNYIATKDISNIRNGFFKLGGMLGSKNNNDYSKGWTPTEVKLGGHWSRVEGKTYHSSELITQSAIKFLDMKTQKNDKPFFMYVSYFAPHDPRQSAKKYLDKYKTKQLKVPPNFLPIYPFDIGVHHIRAEKFLTYPRKINELKIHRRDYYSIITHLDEQIGKLLDKIENHPEYDNTYIIFTSDNGLSMGEHGLYAKQSLFDHAQRVPFFIKGPKITDKITNDTPLNLFQIYSTIAELCDVKLPKSVPNKSFASLLMKDKNNDYNQKYIYGAYKNHSRSVMSKDYKLLLYPLLKKIFLFDRKKDEWEIDNIAQKNPQIIKIFYTKLQELQKETSDKLKLPSISHILTWDKPIHNARADLPKEIIKIHRLNKKLK